MLSQGYFDYNATTPMCQQAIESLNGALCDFGNPSSKYSMATANRHRLDVARKQVARLVGCDSSEIAFTSGGTEANNWAIKGALTSRGCLRRAQPAHIIVSEIEHSSVLEIAAYLERVFGFEVTRIKPNSEGIISAKSVEAALRPNTQLVSIMLVNNEVGTLQRHLRFPSCFSHMAFTSMQTVCKLSERFMSMRTRLVWTPSRLLPISSTVPRVLVVSTLKAASPSSHSYMAAARSPVCAEGPRLFR
jgi:hypothetical protein